MGRVLLQGAVSTLIDVNACMCDRQRKQGMLIDDHWLDANDVDEHDDELEA